MTSGSGARSASTDRPSLPLSFAVLLLALLGAVGEGNAQSVLTVTDCPVAEGNSGTTAAVFTVTLSPAASTEVSVDVLTFDGTASAGLDYAGLVLTTHTFAVGQTSMLVSVTVFGDIEPEYDETFSVYLTNAVGATIEDAEGVGIILNDESPIAVATANWGQAKLLFR